MPANVNIVWAKKIMKGIQCYNAGDLLVPEGIILPVLGASALTWFIRYIVINIYSSKLRNHYKN